MIRIETEIDLKIRSRGFFKIVVASGSGFNKSARAPEPQGESFAAIVECTPGVGYLLRLSPPFRAN